MIVNKRDKKTVRYLHLPKCGGQTFNGVLDREYNRSVIFSFTGNIKLDLENYRKRKNSFKKIQLFRGHAPIETGIPEADSAIIITILREPVDRVKSFCQHVSEGKSPHLVERFPQSTFNLDAFLSSGLDEISNLQTKMLINVGSCGDSTSLSNLGTGRAVTKAFNNLTQRVFLFGLQEKYDETLVFFAHHMNWNLPYYARRNVKSKHKRIVFSEQHIEVDPKSRTIFP